VSAELRQALTQSGQFVWSPERVTFVPEYAKLATAAGACHAEKIRLHRIPPGGPGPRSTARLGLNQLDFQIRNLFYFLPCDFLLQTGSEEHPLPLFSPRDELRQLDGDPARKPEPVGKARSAPRQPPLALTVLRRDFEGKTTLWGAFAPGPLISRLGMTPAAFQTDVRLQFEIDHRLQMRLFFWRGERPHYRVAASSMRLPAPPEGTVADGTLPWQVAVNVLQGVNEPGAETVLFPRGTAWTETFHRPGGETCNGLISAPLPLPEFPATDKHLVYYRSGDGADWQLLGELLRPDVPDDFRPQYRVTLDAEGGVVVHAGEVPYAVADAAEALRDQDGLVVIEELELQPRPSDVDRDPFCGLH
jgi:hypothetical protein